MQAYCVATLFNFMMEFLEHSNVKGKGKRSIMATLLSQSKQDMLIENFIDNLSDVEVDEESDEDSSDEGLCTIFLNKLPIYVCLHFQFDKRESKVMEVFIPWFLCLSKLIKVIFFACTNYCHT